MIEQIIAIVIALLQPLTDQDREKIFERLKAAFCEYCGRKQPDRGMRCQCWNDD